MLEASRGTARHPPPPPTAPARTPTATTAPSTTHHPHQKGISRHLFSVFACALSRTVPTAVPFPTPFNKTSACCRACRRIVAVGREDGRPQRIPAPFSPHRHHAYKYSTAALARQHTMDDGRNTWIAFAFCQTKTRTTHTPHGTPPPLEQTLPGASIEHITTVVLLRTISYTHALYYNRRTSATHRSVLATRRHLFRRLPSLFPVIPTTCQRRFPRSLSGNLARTPRCMGVETRHVSIFASRLH